MNKLRLVLAAIGVFASFIMSSVTDAGEMYQCKGPGKFDSPVWQDTPCNGRSEVEHRKLHDYSKEDASTVGHGRFTSRQASDLIRARKIAVGMSKNDLIKSWGVPTETNTTLTGSGKRQQLVYGQMLNRSYVYMDERNEISSIQYSEAKKRPSNPTTGLGNVNTSGYGKYNKL
ncbi:MAG: hypothetical protein COW18_10040 [Zetaproteobacteria bacterium CG12_big_fil_rev_8_21_14_0_65_54_13]|nr:MAG: hypothetical protein COW18_10040 [Zetaproteobacteria bacterium CG12_big_fil_rev_8_21_14_0_65_54_13]PIX55857.1 MAG: hypothetical protein COZ50_00570 [Zetaproteobacteria bacterium CG_4_10_14_3_um_filter_54_28]PJA30675.1 MAG: hypothetical protein CO188_02450 [Zetaproteobacteria bacterium CG_4_9_14_3_um_filter_54_145]